MKSLFRARIKKDSMFLTCFLVVASFLFLVVGQVSAEKLTAIDFSLSLPEGATASPMGYQLTSYDLTDDGVGPILPDVTNYYNYSSFSAQLGDPTEYTPGHLYEARAKGSYTWVTLGQNQNLTTTEWVKVGPNWCVSALQEFFYEAEDACNNPPALTLDNPSSDYNLNIGDSVTFTGTITDVDVDQTLTLTLQLYDDGGNLVHTMVVPLTPAQSTGGPNQAPWSFGVSYGDLINYGEHFTNAVFVLDDGSETATATYTGNINLSSLIDLVDSLTAAMNVRFAGQIYYPLAIKNQMTNPGDSYDGYSLSSVLNESHQIWTKNMLPHPDVATMSASTVDYPFLVKFFDTNEKIGEIKLGD